MFAQLRRSQPRPNKKACRILRASSPKLSLPPKKVVKLSDHSTPGQGAGPNKPTTTVTTSTTSPTSAAAAPASPTSPGAASRSLHRPIMQAMPDNRQQSFDEIYGAPENFLEIEVPTPSYVVVVLFARRAVTKLTHRITKR